MTANLGKLKSVHVREAWTHEAHNFTPWLADNLDQLGELVGIPDLTFVDKEVQVGPLRADIIASAPNGDGVLIEAGIRTAPPVQGGPHGPRYGALVAHVNSAKCCQNKPKRQRADNTLFENCRLHAEGLKGSGQAAAAQSRLRRLPRRLFGRNVQDPSSTTSSLATRSRCSRRPTPRREAYVTRNQPEAGIQ